MCRNISISLHIFRKEIMNNSRVKVLKITACAICLVISALVSLMIGRYEISFADACRILLSSLVPVEKTWTDLAQNMLLLVRVPRITSAILVGAALSAAGASYQCIFRNPMAAPDILGASTSAGFGAALAILLHLSSGTIMIWAFLASIGCIILVLSIARAGKGSEALNLILAGIMISSLFQAGTSYLKLIADPNNTLPEITYWLMGSLSGITMKEVGFVCLPMLAGFAVLIFLSWKMNLLTIDDEEARTMGVNTRLIRIAVVIASTLLTAASVSVSGIIGWIGLVIPHIGRRFVGNDCRFLIPASALLGAMFLLLVDDLARNLYSTELPLGIITALIGAPFFIYLMLRRGNTI